MSTSVTPLRVLVVDDVPANRRLLARILGRRGHEAVEAASGTEALARLTEGEVDLIFMDVLLPGMDGRETTRRIRAGYLSSARIVGVTGLASDDARTECLEAGMDAMVTKPFSVAEVERLIDEVVATRHV